MSKSDEATILPLPINIKTEKPDKDVTLQSMSYYLDDRLELVKQIFTTLKPKTINNLTPDYLKSENMEKIQELCFNELLGMSTKRLLSIIDDIKCPTDTESSDDQDVKQKMEHVSLEEISSDSDRENGSKKKEINHDLNKTTVSIAEEPTGQISVLELLELQARARAIRSQLALEPITKIEVDGSDLNNGDDDDDNDDVNDDDDNDNDKRNPKNVQQLVNTDRQSRTSKSKSKSKSREPKPTAVTTTPTLIANKKKLTNGVKEPDDNSRSSYNSNESNSNSEIELMAIDKLNSNDDNERKRKSSEKNVIERKQNKLMMMTERKKNNNNIIKNGSLKNSNKITTSPTTTAMNCLTKTKRNLRNSNKKQDVDDDNDNDNDNDNDDDNDNDKNTNAVEADVIPVVSQPVTVQISDTSDEDETQDVSDKITKQIVGNHFTKLDDKEDNSRNCTSSETEEGEISEDTQTSIEIENENENELKKEDNGKEEKMEISNRQQIIHDYIELVHDDDDDMYLDERKSNNQDVESNINVITNDNVTVTANKNVRNVDESENHPIDKKMEEKSTAEVKEEEIKITAISLNLDDKKLNANEATAEELEKDDQQQKEEPPSMMPIIEKGNKEQIEQNFITTNTEEEITKSETWSTRNLKSAKISKVLAASRLSKRVRDKIKNQAKTIKANAMKTDQINKDISLNNEHLTNEIITQYEEGSVKQYKELINLKVTKIPSST